MRNRPFSEWSLPDNSAGSTPGPQGRLRLLSAGIVCILCVIGIRVYHVQVVLPDRFLAPWTQTHQVQSDVPNRIGRILSRDGAVLADDVTRYSVAVHYRWLEQPFDRVWLQRQVSARLTPEERHDPELRSQIEQSIQMERTELISRLAQLTQLPVPQLQQRAEQLQLQVERMVAAVEERRSQASTEQAVQPLRLESGLGGILSTIRTELTTPPRRYADDPIILKEELQPHILIEDVPLEVAAAIQSQPHLFPGVRVQSTSARRYPFDDLASHVIGVRRPSNGGEDRRVEGGVEEAFNELLSGQPGQLTDEVTRRGDIVTSRLSRPPVDGQDVVLTIDSRLQRTAESLLDQQLNSQLHKSPPTGGAIIVMDLWTGDLLCMAAAPRFSLNLMQHPSEDEWAKLVSDPARPFFPRATQMALPPGSVFKVVTAAAALQAGLVTPDEVLHCRGYLHHPSRDRCAVFRKTGLGHGDVSLEAALCQSCNVFFFELAERVGPKQMLDWSRRFGFGSGTGFLLPGESAGELPEFSSSSGSNRADLAEAKQMAIGQGKLLATPLQVTRMMAAIGNGGFLVTPQLVATAIETDAQRALQPISELTERTLTTLRLGLEKVVHHPQGTGTAALTESMTIAAKTGTAEVAGHPDHAWFAGFAPIESPRIAFCVVLEHGGSGGDVAGPLVRELMTEMIGLGLLLPQWDE